MEIKPILIDGFRFVDNLHTTARQLPVFTTIAKTLHNKQLHKKILEQLIVEWSIHEEEKNDMYKKSKGKVTNGDRRTAALRYHLESSPFIGLTKRYNDLYINSKLSNVFTYLLLETNRDEHYYLIERIFYIYLLLVRDADGILLCISEISNSSGKHQKTLQDNFKNGLNKRLLSKQEFAPNNIKSIISEKYRSINFIWKKPEKYAEHIIAPRFEWLSYLGIVEIKRETKSTIYSLTETGKSFYNNLPQILGEDNIKDINDLWINEQFFTFLDTLFRGNRLEFKNLPVEKQDTLLGTSLEHAMKAVHSSMSFKLPVVETFVYIAIESFLKGVILNFFDIRIKLKKLFEYGNKTYLLKEAGRVNEGYITVNVQR